MFSTRTCSNFYKPLTSLHPASTGCLGEARLHASVSGWARRPTCSAILPVSITVFLPVSLPGILVVLLPPVFFSSSLSTSLFILLVGLLVLAVLIPLDSRIENWLEICLEIRVSRLDSRLATSIVAVISTRLSNRSKVRVQLSISLPLSDFGPRNSLSIRLDSTEIQMLSSRFLYNHCVTRYRRQGCWAGWILVGSPNIALIPYCWLEPGVQMLPSRLCTSFSHLNSRVFGVWRIGVMGWVFS